MMSIKGVEVKNFDFAQHKIKANMKSTGLHSEQEANEHGRIAIVVSADGALNKYTSNCGQASLIFSCEEFDISSIYHILYIIVTLY